MSESSAERVAVVGPGAIGGAVAGALLEAGHDVVLCGRSGRVDRLRVDHGHGAVDRAVTWRTDPDGLAPVHAVLFAVKAHQSEAAAGWLRALAGPDTPIAVLQNGVDHRERIAPLVGADVPIVPTVVHLPARRQAPDHVVVRGTTARLTMAASPEANRIASLFDGSFVQAKVVDDWLTPAWTKLMLNAASGGICTLTRTDNLVFHDKAARDLAVRAMREVAEVGRAEGAELATDLPERIVDGLLAAASGHRASIVVDRLAERPTEWRVRNAVVVERAARHGIDVPLNRLLTTLLRLGEPTEPTESTESA